MNITVKLADPLTLSVECHGVVVQTYHFLMLTPDGQYVELNGSNAQATLVDSHSHEFAPPIPAGTKIRGIISYTTTNGAQPFVGVVKLLQGGTVVPNSVDTDSRSTSVDGVAAHVVEYAVV